MALCILSERVGLWDIETLCITKVADKVPLVAISLLLFAGQGKLWFPLAFPRQSRYIPANQAAAPGLDPGGSER